MRKSDGTSRVKKIRADGGVHSLGKKVDRPEEGLDRGAMRIFKITVAFCISLVGVLLPWRARIAYSELLGWVAQLFPPSTYNVDVRGRDEQRS